MRYWQTFLLLFLGLSGKRFFVGFDKKKIMGDSPVKPPEYLGFLHLDFSGFCTNIKYIVRFTL